MGSNADRREDQERRYVLVSVKAETWGRNMSARYLQDGFNSILQIEDLNARSRSAAVWARRTRAPAAICDCTHQLMIAGASLVMGTPRSTPRRRRQLRRTVSAESEHERCRPGTAFGIMIAQTAHLKVGEC